jgi:uncharacterized membrane protein YeiH
MIKKDLMKYNSSELLFTLDLAGTFVFAVEGAMAAIRGNLDFLGLMVLSFATALGGGVVRDLLIGAVPPGAIRDWRYSVVAFTGATVTFFLHHFVQEIPSQVLIALDAAGLALFAVAGTQKALNYGIHPFMAILMGTITGVGGGTVRDILLAQVPTVLRADVYATAAMAGAAVMILGRKFGLRPALTAVLGGVFCFVLRVVSVWQHWNLPRVAGS